MWCLPAFQEVCWEIHFWTQAPVSWLKGYLKTTLVWWETWWWKWKKLYNWFWGICKGAGQWLQLCSLLCVSASFLVSEVLIFYAIFILSTYILCLITLYICAAVGYVDDWTSVIWTINLRQIFLLLSILELRVLWIPKREMTHALFPKFIQWWNSSRSPIPKHTLGSLQMKWWKWQKGILEKLFKYLNWQWEEEQLV